MRTIALPLLGLLACKTNGDTDTEDDTDDGGNPVMMSGAVTLPDGVIVSGDEVTVGLIHVPDLGDEGIAFGDILDSNPIGALSADANGSWYIVWPDVPDDDLFFVDDETGDTVAMFMLVAWVDTDGDGQFAVGEMPIGGSLQLIAYAKGEVSEDTATRGGVADSWHRVTIDFTTEDGDIALEVLEPGASDVDLEANLLPRSRGDLFFSLTCDCADKDVTVDLVPSEVFTGAEPSERFASVVVSVGAEGSAESAFADLTFAARPPEEHIATPFAEPGAEADAAATMAPYVAFVIDDLDGDGHMDFGTEPVLASGDNAFLSWLEPRTFDAVFLPQFAGIDMGWGLLSADEDAEGPTPIAWADGLTLVPSE